MRAEYVEKIRIRCVHVANLNSKGKNLTAWQHYTQEGVGKHLCPTDRGAILKAITSRESGPCNRAAGCNGEKAKVFSSMRHPLPIAACGFRIEVQSGLNKDVDP